MISKSVLLAAPTHGTSSGHVPGPLTGIADCSLIKRSLLGLEQYGIHDVVVVVGEDGDAIRDEIGRDSDITARITWLVQEGATVVEALKRARPYLDGPFVALHANLLFSPEILGKIVDRDEEAAPALLVDRKLSRVFDVDASLKVATEEGRVSRLGFDLDGYDAVAVGMAVLTPEVLDRWRSSDAETMLALLAPLVNGGELAAWDINGALWQQVHSTETQRHGEWLLRAYGEDLHDDSVPSSQESGIKADPHRTLSYIEGLLNENRARHYVLMNPGPVLTSPRVKSALVHHDVCHRDDDYTVVARRVQRKLRRVCRGGAEHDILLLSGSGTAAMEAAISSCVPEDGKLLVVSNGAFGERFVEIAEVHRLGLVHLRYEWGELVDPADIDRALTDDPSIMAVVMCHHETSVGILNPVNRVGDLCRAHDRMFFVDAVSSLGAEDIDVRRDKIDVLISSANKCLHAISGVSFACVNRRVWHRIEEIPPRGYYLDLKRYKRMGIPFTPAVSNFFALDAALGELLRDGLQQRHHRYRRLNQLLRRELRRIGLERMTNTGHESHTITTLKVPEYTTYKELYRALKERGYIIYGCKAQFKDRYFQVANMGDLSDEMVRGFIDTTDAVLEEARQQRRASIRVAS